MLSHFLESNGRGREVFLLYLFSVDRGVAISSIVSQILSNVLYELILK